MPPELDFALVSEVPPIANDAVLVGIATGEERGLDGAGHRREQRVDRGPLSLLSEGAQTWRRWAEQTWGQPNSVENDSFTHVYVPLT